MASRHLVESQSQYPRLAILAAKKCLLLAISLG